MQQVPQQTSSFSPSLHVVLCQHCGAPLQASVTGGMMPCRFCGAQNRVAARNMTFVAQARTSAPLPEHERISRLRAQDGKPMLPPSSLMGIFQGGGIPVWKMQEAMAIWQATRKQLEYSDAQGQVVLAQGVGSSHHTAELKHPGDELHDAGELHQRRHAPERTVLVFLELVARRQGRHRLHAHLLD